MICLKQKGMVLLTVLLVLGLMSMLLLANMQSLFLYDKLTQAFELKDKVIEQLEKNALEKLIRWGRGGDSDCVVRDLGPNKVMDYIMTNGCLLDGSLTRLKYLISDLGVMSDHQITLGTRVFGVKQGLITVITTGAPTIGVQLRMAFTVPLDATIYAQKLVHPMLEGVMSWRLIEDSNEY